MKSIMDAECGKKRYKWVFVGLWRLKSVFFFSSFNQECSSKWELRIKFRIKLNQH